MRKKDVTEIIAEINSGVTQLSFCGVKVIAEALKTNTSVTELDFVDAQKRTKYIGDALYANTTITHLRLEVKSKNRTTENVVASSRATFKERINTKLLELSSEREKSRAAIIKGIKAEISFSDRMNESVIKELEEQHRSSFRFLSWVLECTKDPKIRFDSQIFEETLRVTCLSYEMHDHEQRAREILNTLRIVPDLFTDEVSAKVVLSNRKTVIERKELLAKLKRTNVGIDNNGVLVFIPDYGDTIKYADISEQDRKTTRVTSFEDYRTQSNKALDNLAHKFKLIHDAVLDEAKRLKVFLKDLEDRLLEQFDEVITKSEEALLELENKAEGLKDEEAVTADMERRLEGIRCPAFLYLNTFAFNGRLSKGFYNVTVHRDGKPNGILLCSYSVDSLLYDSDDENEDEDEDEYLG